MKLFVERSGEEKQFFFEGSAGDLVRKIGLNTEEVLIIKNGELVTEDELITDSDFVKLLSVVSGG